MRVSDIISTNSFGANRLVQDAHGLADKSAEMAFEAAGLVRGGADQAGSAKVILPGIGYPCCPDHSLKRDALALLPADLGISLTESCAMVEDKDLFLSHLRNE